ncbi:MAG: hypothetical protein J6K61_03505 [Clostridia bacterium]|nr:hypothetical protein [Clostridia bacterium]
MVKTICKKVYDTEDSVIILKKTNGVFGDPQGYEETLYQTKDGKYFLYVNGGSESIYPKEDIKRLSADAAKKFLEA